MRNYFDLFIFISGDFAISFIIIYLNFEVFYISMHSFLFDSTNLPNYHHLRNRISVTNKCDLMSNNELIRSKK